MKTTNIKGKITPGTGKAAGYLKLPWVKKQIKEKLGFTPYPGTLNIKLLKTNTTLKNLLKKATSTAISPEDGFSSGKCFKAYLKDSQTCAIIIPEIENYPSNLIEVIAPEDLRQKLHTKNDDTITLKILLQ